MRQACTLMLEMEGKEAVICGWSDIFADRAWATFLLVTAETGGEWDNEELERIFNEH